MTNSNQTESKIVGVMTSGGDSQGMNAVIRAIVRFGLFKKFKVHLIYEGYQGLLSGGDLIKEAKLSTVDHIIHLGGTIIGSARPKEMRGPEGRATAALTLIKRGISNLIVIGGEGSLTGANFLSSEWKSIIETLLKNGKISEEESKTCQTLRIIGIVGTIDNDFCGTDMTTGCNTAEHRIVESVDAIATTGNSHQQAMIIEVMGRDCGYLALVSAMAIEATFVFLPEQPPADNWPEIIAEKIEMERKHGRRLSIILVSMGALDLSGRHITCDEVMKKLTAITKREVRAMNLDHIQRGGYTSAYDRILGTRMGTKAIEYLESNKMTESIVMTLNDNRIFGKSLTGCVEQTRALHKAMNDREWKKCIELRGMRFERSFDILRKIHKKDENRGNTEGKHFAVMQVGEPAPGMNAAVYSFVRILLLNDKSAFGINDGFEGLVKGKIFEMKWLDVDGWTGQSGALLGTSRVPNKISKHEFEEMAKNLNKTQIKGIGIIGGFKAINLLEQIVKVRKTFPELQIPFCIIPATIENNVPGMELSLGSDTTINKITQSCTDILMSTKGTKGRLYLAHMTTGHCGYLTVMSAIASEADFCYIFEKKFTENDIKNDAQVMRNKMSADSRNRLIIVNEFANIHLKNKTIADIYSAEGKGMFNVVSVDLTHLMQSLSPSPFDRIYGIKLGVRCADWFRSKSKYDDSEKAVVLGLSERKYSFTDINELIQKTDIEHQIPKNEWYLDIIDLVNLCF